MSRMKYFDMMRRTAKRVCKILEEKGFKTYISNTRPLPIRKILRESWYVEKMSQFGIIDVIHIGICNGNYNLGFLAITNDCKIASGCNAMINDFFSDARIECGNFDGFYFCDYNMQFAGDEDDGMVICDLHTFERFMSELAPCEVKEEILEYEGMAF